MNYFRKLVSGHRRRFQFKNYDLDITYVTKRVVGMSFPAKGIEQMYRNNINDVAAFMRDRHPDAYLIFNLSNRKYDYKKFENRVIDYEWEDHHAPALHILFQICQQMFDFISDNPNNVVIVNCNAGKGRTGTSISCFLMFSGLSECSRDAITYYGWQRFDHGNGVTQPSQLRYIHYFEKVYKKQIMAPLIKILDKIIITTVPKVSKKGCQPFVEVMDGKNYSTIWTNKHSQNLRYYKFQDSQDLLASMSSGGSNFINSGSQKIIIEIDSDPILCGDIYMRLIHKGGQKNKLICRFTFNTSFVQDNYYEFNKWTVDPDSIQKNKNFNQNFKVELFFRDFCKNCTSQTPLEKICSRCQTYMQDDIKNWKEIHKILDSHKYPDHKQGTMMNFLSSQSDYHETIKKEIPINTDNLIFEEESQYEESDEEFESKDQTTLAHSKSGGLHGGIYEEVKMEQEKCPDSPEKKSKYSKKATKYSKYSKMAIRETLSDTDEINFGEDKVNRAKEMLSVNDLAEEIDLKTGANQRKRSEDYLRDRRGRYESAVDNISKFSRGVSFKKPRNYSFF